MAARTTSGAEDGISASDIERFFMVKLKAYYDATNAQKSSPPKSHNARARTTLEPEVNIETRLLSLLSEMEAFKEQESEPDSSSEEESDTDNKAESQATSLLDLDIADLNMQLRQKANVVEVENEEPKIITKYVTCKFCKVPFPVMNGDFLKSLAVHRKDEYHVKVEQKRRRRNEERKESEFCSVCNLMVTPGGKHAFLLHLQSEEHKDALQNRFKDKPSNRSGKNNELPEEKAEESKDPLALAMGMACIQPLTENSMHCTMCKKMIPTASDLASLMKNVGIHIQGTEHSNNLKAMEAEIKNVKAKSSFVREIIEDKKRQTREPYYFICLACGFDGYGLQYCRYHLQSPMHKKKAHNYLLKHSGMANFDNGEQCKVCRKHLFGNLSEIEMHKANCKTQVSAEKKVQRKPRKRRVGKKGPESKNSASVDEGAERKPITPSQPQPDKGAKSKENKRNKAKEKNDCSIM